jgi:fluoroacetyl-CoA thioesterase
MKQLPRIGAVGEIRFTVESQHAVDFSAEGLPPVLSTPWLIWFLEHAAREVLGPLLEPGESSVGIEVELQHLAPTPLGQTVRCLARVAAVDGPRISFCFEAHDEQELIARGFHRRHIVRADRFTRAVEKKKKTAP